MYVCMYVCMCVNLFCMFDVQVSVIQYAKASEIKRGINKQFAETFPHVKISLSNLRSIKKDICVIAREVSLTQPAAFIKWYLSID